MFKTILCRSKENEKRLSVVHRSFWTLVPKDNNTLLPDRSRWAKSVGTDKGKLNHFVPFPLYPRCYLSNMQNRLKRENSKRATERRAHPICLPRTMIASHEAGERAALSVEGMLGLQTVIRHLFSRYLPWTYEGVTSCILCVSGLFWKLFYPGFLVALLPGNDFAALQNVNEVSSPISNSISLHIILYSTVNDRYRFTWA